jgi:hypothetical protein
VSPGRILVSAGLAVFPVAADCRRPLTTHGCKDAVKGAQAIRDLWRRFPGANVAVACGAISGVFVLDVDRKHGIDGAATMRDLIFQHGPVPVTWRTITPTGGCHLWFRQPDRRLRNRVGFLPGLDVRTDGGSVTVPPSRRPDGDYSWKIAPDATPLADAPAWLLDLIDPQSVVRAPVRPIRVGSLDRTARYVAAAINGECGAVASMKADTGRNHRLFQAAARLGELVGAGLAPQSTVEHQLEDAANECGLTQEDGRRAVLATIASGLSRGLTNPREIAT